MKSFIILILVIISFVFTNESKAQKEVNYVNNELILCFKEPVSSILKDGNDVLVNENYIQFFKVQKVEKSRKLKRSDKNKTREFRIKINSTKNIKEVIEEFQKTGWFTYVEPNYTGEGASMPCEVSPNDASYNKQWGLHNDGTFNSTSVSGIDINAQKAWYLSQGSSNVIVAIIDGGAKLNHSELSGRIWHNSADDEGPGTGNGVDDDGNGYIDDRIGWDFNANDNDPSDLIGHGTAITGVIGANGNNSSEYAGVDWNCELMILRGLGNTLGGNYADWAEAIYYAVDNGADVINMSLGGNSSSTALSNAVNYAHSNNVVIVASMMNTNNTVVHYPAAYTNTIAVGSIDSDGQRSEPFTNVFSYNSAGSCYGSHIDVCAPGNLIWGIKPNSFAPSYWSGTSLAAPHVTGTISLMKAVDNTLSFSAIRTILHTTSIDQVGNSSEDIVGFDNYHGHGKIDAYEALHYIIGDVTTSSTETICDNETFNFNGQTLGANDAGSHSYSSCDSIFNLNLVVNETYTSSSDVSLCSGQTYNFGGQTYTSSDSGIHTQTLTSTNTCDSVVSINIISMNGGSFNDAVTICQGETHQLGSQSLSQSGTYTEVFQSNSGCDSTVVLNLTVLNNQSSNINETICAGTSYQLGSQSLNQSGVYTEVFQTMNGCDSTVTLNLSIEAPITNSINQSICQGSTYQFGSQLLTSNDGGSHTEIFQTINGCDSTVTLNLSIEAPITNSVSQSICQGSTYQFGSQLLTSNDGGSHTEVFQTANGCDSTVTLNLSVLNNQTNNISQSICQGNSFSLGGQTLTQSGMYTEVFQAFNGCDSTVTLNLTVLSNVTNSLTETICHGTSFQLGSQNLSQSGTYTEVFQAFNGCDSTVTLNLTVLNDISNSSNETICYGSSYQFGSQNLTQSGMYTEVFQAFNGCDSTVTLNLTVLSESSYSFTQSICSGITYQLGSQSLSQSGTYTEIFQTVNGCDSTVTLNLFINAPIINSLSQSICQGDVYQFGSQSLTQAGVYTEIFQAFSGCDSTVTLNLQVFPPESTSSSVVICNGSTYQFGSQLLTSNDAGTHTEIFQSMNGCDSTVTLSLSINGSPNSSSQNEEICQGDSFTFGSQTVTQTGTYTETFQNISGCDSVVTLNLSVNVTPYIIINQVGADLSSSFGQSYQWYLNGNIINGATSQTYTPLEDGVYSVEVLSNNGCTGYAEYEMLGVSILELSGFEDQISVYPNPSRNSIHVELKELGTINIYNSLGELVYSGFSKKRLMLISVKEFNKGVYYIVSGNNVKRLIVI